MLTKHQRFHLEAVIADTVRHSSTNVSAGMVDKLAGAKEVKPKDWDKYLEHVRKAAQAMLNSGIFPAKLECASDIHDYLEYDTPFSSGVING